MITGKIKVLIVDDHPAVRVGLSAIINYQDDIEVVGQAENGAEAIELFESIPADVMLVDLSLPDLTGIELIKILRAKGRDTQFIVLTANAGGGEIAQALQAGAHAYLFKNSPVEVLLEAIRTVFGGGRYLSPEVWKSADALARVPELTAKELEVVRWLVRGHSNAQTAAEMAVAETTIKFHVKNIMSKLGVNSRSKVAAVALQLGIVKA